MKPRGVLYLTSHRGRIGVDRSSLVVRKPEGTTKVPIEAVEAVVLLAGQITTEAMTLCVRKGVRISALSRTGRLRFWVGGPVSGNVLLRVSQVRVAGERAAAGAIARAVVAAKLRGYLCLLQRWSWDSSGTKRWLLQREAQAVGERLQAIEPPMDGNRLRGVEGDATRRYFNGLAVVLADAGDVGRFPIRSRRPPADPANALMSFLYALATTEIIGGLEAVGLDPQVGFLHGLRPGRPALALDLLEEVRPLCDRVVARSLRRRELRIDHFTRMANGGCSLSDAGRGIALRVFEEHRDQEIHHPLLDRPVPRWSLPSLQATLLARHLRGDLPAYPPFALR